MSFQLGQLDGLRGNALGALSHAPVGSAPAGVAGPIFSASLQSTLVPELATGSSTPTFTRATTAYVADWENLLKSVLSGEARFTGARRVENILPFSDDLTQNVGSTAAATVTATTVEFTNATAYRYKTIPTIAGAQTFTARVTLSSSDKAQIGLRSGTGTFAACTLSSTPKTFSISWPATGAGVDICGLDNRVGLGGDGTTTGTVTVVNWQIEVTTGQSNTNPSEFVSRGVASAPYHGAGVDGVKYFTTKNGNTVASNVVTEATGAAINLANGGSASTVDASGPFGYFAEGARTNRCLQSQVFSNASWVSGGGGITVTNNSIAAPDGTTTADTLTAAGANGTLIQDLGVVASASKTGGLWLKRKTGTGNIDLTMDGGATWTTVAVDANWTRFSKNQTLADEDFGIRIVTSGDEVYAWQAQVETAAFLSSAIPTTTAAVTRNGDALTYPFADNASASLGTCYAEITPSGSVVDGVALSFAVGLYCLQFNSSTALRMLDGTNNPVINTGPFSYGTTYKAAGKWGNSVMGGTASGAAIVSGSFDGDIGSTSIGVSPGTRGRAAPLPG